MENEISEVSKKSLKYWFLPVTLGVIFVLVGVKAFFTPAESFSSLTTIFIVTFLVTGVLDLVFSNNNKNTLVNSDLTMTTGLLDVFVALLLILNPNISMVSPVIIFAFGLLFRTVMNINWSIKLKDKGLSDWGGLLAVSLLGVILSFLMVCNPIISGLTLEMYIGSGFVAVGAFQVYFSLRLNKLNK